MKERIAQFLRKVFGAARVVGKVLAKIVPIVLAELRAGHIKTDAEIRNLVKWLVVQEINARYPGYEFLVEQLVNEIVNIVRERIRKHSVN